MNKEEVESMINNDEIFDPIVESAFVEHDTNKNGFIDKKELFDCLVKVYKLLSPEKVITKEDVNQFLQHYDTNKDEMISKSEFKPFLKKVIINLAEQGKL